MEQSRAEGVDGLDLEPTRGVQREGEQPPCPGSQHDIRCEIRNSENCLIQACIIKGGPATQLIEHPVGHIGGGCLRECDAEDSGWMDAIEQEPNDALRQHMRLAGAGIGRNPSRPRRVRRLHLDAPESFRDNARGAGYICRHIHSCGPISSSLPADHSFTRARWS